MHMLAQTIEPTTKNKEKLKQTIEPTTKKQRTSKKSIEKKTAVTVKKITKKHRIIEQRTSNKQHESENKEQLAQTIESTF